MTVLTINAGQLRTLERASAARLEKDVLESLREDLPGYVDDEQLDEFRAFLRSCIERAQTCGLQTRIEILAFVECACLLDDAQFDDDPDLPWAQVILRNRFLDPEERADRLVAFARFEALPPDED